jgi:hemoglobin-like flavoprotein
MTSDHIALVQASFAEVLPMADRAAAMFYERLFVLDSTLRSLFHGNMQEQGHKLMAVLKLAVAGLSRLEELLPLVRQLGVRHRGYGVTEAHYATVGAALLWTLEQGLGEGFTPEVRAAWSNAYTLLANTMRATGTAADSSETAAVVALAVAGDRRGASQRQLSTAGSRA